MYYVELKFLYKGGNILFYCFLFMINVIDFIYLLENV